MDQMWKILFLTHRRYFCDNSDNLSRRKTRKINDDLTYRLKIPSIATNKIKIVPVTKD